MDFMTSLFGGEPDGAPRGRRKVRVSSDPRHPGLEVNGLRGQDWAAKSLGMAGNLPPEEEEGNVEYKLKLVNPSDARKQHLVTQLKWRLREGNGEAIYEIGVEDNGVCQGLDAEELEASMETLRYMAAQLAASLSVLRKREVVGLEGPGPPRHVLEVLLRRVPESQEFIDLRVAVVGGADAGKSTLLGVLTSGETDDGRGRARLNLFRHLHEVQSGRTSSISLEIAGFDSQGSVVNYAEHSVEEICEKSTKLVTFIDLAGHHKFLRTTVFGLTGYAPHFVALVVPANGGLTATAREHLAISVALRLPVFVVLSKTDVASKAQLATTLRRLEEALKGPGLNKVPQRMTSDDDAVSAAQAMHSSPSVPIFLVSSVSGKGLARLQRFLNLLPPSKNPRERSAQIQLPAHFAIDEIFNVPGVGTVAAGLLERGVVREGDWLLLGPDPSGAFRRTQVESLQRSKAPCRVVEAGEAASLALGKDEAGEELVVRKGMVLLGPSVGPRASLVIAAELFLLSHPGEQLCLGFQATLHIGNVCQVARIVDIEGKPCVRKQSPVQVKLAFLNRPEYVCLGARLLLRDAATKGIGQVTEIALDPLDLPAYSPVPRPRTF